jgi:hypothetical protein
MDKIVAYCGIICAECPACKATRDNNDEERKRIAAEWSKQYSSDIKPEDVNCRGCMDVDGPWLGYCMTCEIRKCGKQKQVENCAFCAEFACTRLTEFLKMAPAAKTNLEEIRSKHTGSLEK